ncbi:MAG TPA: GspH/FimT family pseudopilin [Thermoanaerobaculia bacterium]|nr:GspH/FimT family pseudopilin [Thermoanaerobaculia bacterium]
MIQRLPRLPQLPVARSNRRVDEGGGYGALELIAALAIVGLVTLLTLPSVLEWSAAQRVEAAAAELVGTLRLARTYAMRHSANVALKFHLETAETGITRVWFALYRDGDGDGVRNDDLARGVDPRVTRPRQLATFGSRVRFGFPAGTVPSDPSDPGRRLDRLDDPIRFNRSDLASFGPLGTSTPGSLYVTDGRRLAVVRVQSRAGRVRVLRWDPAEERWR